MRATKTFSLIAIETFKQKMLLWAQQYHEVVWLDSNMYPQTYSSFDNLLAVDAFTSIKTDSYLAFEDLKAYQSSIKDWIFGYLTYDLKNDVEELISSNADELDFPELFFFQPKKIIKIKGDQIEFNYLNMIDDEIDRDFDAICNLVLDDKQQPHTDVRIKLRVHKDEYHNKVNDMLRHIHLGNIYEANFCQEFYAENVIINPYVVYNHLNKISKAPFSVFFRLGEKYLLSASPERYLRKEGNKIISQPIKGTAKRSEDIGTDEQLKQLLESDPKERSENIMIVDLVRNDLSKHAVKGSVEVEELCKIYTFKQVHQMISTIKAIVDETTSPVDIIRDSFPMGSMTGAPKIEAMKIIEALEVTKRGLYSGAVGYFTPDNDFDFNVIIRSILYDSDKQYASFSVGSAITANSVPEKEYEECLVKAKAMRMVLENS